MAHALVNRETVRELPVHHDLLAHVSIKQDKSPNQIVRYPEFSYQRFKQSTALDTVIGFRQINKNRVQLLFPIGSPFKHTLEE